MLTYFSKEHNLMKIFKITFLLYVTMIIQSCNNINNEPFVFQAELIENYSAEIIKESKVEFIKWEKDKSFFRLATNRIQENQKITSIKCDFENGLYRFIFILSPDNWRDPHPFKSQIIDFCVTGLPTGKIKIAVSLNYGDIQLKEYIISLNR